VTDRKLLPLCGGCKYTSFCDIECARSHWPDHKSWCLGIQIRQIRREHLQSWCKDSDKATVAGKECLLSMLALVVRFTPMSVIEAGSIVASYSEGGGMPVHIYNDFMTTGDVDEFLQLASSLVCCFLPCTDHLTSYTCFSINVPAGGLATETIKSTLIPILRVTSHQLSKSSDGCSA